MNIDKVLQDLREGMARAPFWCALAWQDTRQRYRRSILGPFWITISTGVMVGAMGPLYGAFFGVDVASYLQHLAISLILWTFIATTLNEAGASFIGAEGFIKQVRLPLSVHIFRLLAKNLLALAHNFVIVLLVLIIFPPAYWGNIWLFPVGLFLIVANLFWISMLLALLSTRFRDIPQLVSAVIQVLFFLSPVLWKPEMLSPRNRFIADLNPLYHFMELLRAPLLGTPFNASSWTLMVVMLVLGATATLLVFARLRARVPYWI